MIIFWAAFVFSSCFLTAVESSTVVVDSPFGKILGAKKTIENTGVSYLYFRGIPYAKPPLGDLRFAKPQPHPKLEGVFDATKEGQIRCPSPSYISRGDPKYREDCLVLFIVTKAVHPANDLRKVIVFIHGGAFILGDAEYLDAKSFVTSQDVVYVAMNYRLGILGFLSTENEASPGNYGLWDQALAMKWVKDNIRAFGGDPDDITLAGESSGAASVGFHVLSPHTKGLFTKAYMHSGTASAVFAISIGAQSHALSVAKMTGCWDGEVNDKVDVKDSMAVMECLRNVSMADIIDFSDFKIYMTQFVPVVDGNFVPDIITNLLQDDDHLESVGFFHHPQLIVLNNAERTTYDNYFLATKYAINSNAALPEDQKQAAYQGILTMAKIFYQQTRLGETMAADENLTNKIDDFYNRRFQGDFVLTELMSDLSFLIPSLDYLAAASRRKSSSAYLLYIDYFPHYMKGMYRGVAHALDMPYWFDIDITGFNANQRIGIQGQFTEEDDELKRSFSTVLGDFVKTGNPGLTLEKTLPSGWPKYDVRNSHYLNFNSKPWVSSFLEKDKQDLWFDTVPNNLMEQARVFSTGSSPKQYPSIALFVLSSILSLVF